METLVSFGLWLKERRKKLDLTQAELAETLNNLGQTLLVLENLSEARRNGQPFERKPRPRALRGSSRNFSARKVGLVQISLPI